MQYTFQINKKYEVEFYKGFLIQLEKNRIQ